MLKTSNEIKSQLTPVLQKLLTDVLSEAVDHLLVFCDEQEYMGIYGVPFPEGVNARVESSNNRSAIFLKKLETITIKEECDIAHELGHLWLVLLGLPTEDRTADINRQVAYETFFGPLREIMEHAVYYPLLKAEYEIDLHKVGNGRLCDFIKNLLPTLKDGSENERLLLIVNYLKYSVEANNNDWLNEMRTVYIKKTADLKDIVDILLPIIQGFASNRDPHDFRMQYVNVLEILHLHFDIPKDSWPKFIDELE